MSRHEHQRRILLELLRELGPHLRSDRELPARIRRRLAGDRRFGGRDRRLYRELLYTAVRFLPWIEARLERDPVEGSNVLAWLAAEDRDTRSFRDALTGALPPRPPELAECARILGEDPMALLPDWATAEAPAIRSAGELDALHRRAPVWLRLHGVEAEALDAELATAGWRIRPSGVLSDAVEALRTEPSAADLTRTDAWARGTFEVQDLGSQMVLASLGTDQGEPTWSFEGGSWLDACAGAGGKALQLATLVGPGGRVDASDPRERALEELGRRSSRGGLGQIRILSGPPTGGPGERRSGYDGVLVDAPCSGSGTWRRAPHLKWTVTREDLRRQAARQAELLARYAPLVRPGGLLVYATCSLARTENEVVVGTFLERHPDFQPVPPARSFGFAGGPFGLPILPARHDTDAFHVASLRRLDP